MKKKFLIIPLAAILMVFGALFTVRAASSAAYNNIYSEAVKMTQNGVFASGTTVTADCPYCGVSANWTPLSSITAAKDYKQKGHYYLPTDLSNGSYYGFYADSCVHLNGHDLTSSARAFYVDTAINLNIMGDGVVTGKGLSNTTCNRGGAVDNCGVLNLFGGTYKHTGSYPTLVARSTKSTINVYDGTLVQGTTRVIGSNIHVYTGALNVYGGVIENGIAEQGGNIYGGKNATVTIAGGKITGSTVYMSEDATSLTLTGAPQIDVINNFDGPEIIVAQLTQGADIQIVGQGVITKSRADMDDYEKYFRSPNELVKLSVKDGSLYGEVDTTANSTAPLTDGKTLKILCLTSSFGLNTTELLYDIAVAEGFEEVIVARLYASGCSLQKHVESYNNNVKVYTYTKFTSEGKTTVNEAHMLDGLLDESWDIIFIQQGAEQTGQLKTYLDYLDQLMEIVHANKTNPNAKFIWNMTWAFQSDNTRTVFTKTFQNSQLFMHSKIIDAMQEKIMTRSDFSAMIPSGAAVQNARTSYFGDRLTKDTLHLNNLGRVIAGYALYATLVDKDLTEVNVGSVSCYDLTTPIRLSETDRQVVIEAVNAARANPFAVNQSKYTPEYLNGIGQKAASLSFTTGSATSAHCPYCEKDVVWQPLTNTSINKLVSTDGNWGHYYLAEDLTYSDKYLYADTEDGHKGYCLHLNGHNILNNGTRALWVGAGNTMNIMGSGTISGVGEGSSNDNYRAAALDVNGHANLFGGTLTPNASRPTALIRTAAARINLFDGASIEGNPNYTASLVNPRIAGAEFNMFGGTVTGGKATNGGNIYINANATFNLFGGTVSDGFASEIGGNVYASDGVVNIYGGLITGGRTENTTSSLGRGGNVALNGTKNASRYPAFHMYGGTLGGTAEEGKTAGSASSGGANLYVAYGTATINGKDAMISNGEGNIGGNVLISSIATVTLTEGTIINGKTTSHGGNIYLAGTTSNLVVTGGTVQDGHSGSYGGNVYANNGSVTISGGTFIGGTSPNGGSNLHLKVGNADATNMVTIDHDAATAANAPLIEGGSIYITRYVTLGKFTLSAENTPAVEIDKSAILTILPSFEQDIHATVAETLLGTPIYGSTVANATAQGKFPGKIYLDGYEDAPYLYAADGDTALYVTGTALVDTDGNKTWYESTADAIKDYGSNTAWLQAGPGELTLGNGNYLLDIAGQTVNLTGSGNVTCFDSSNDDYQSFGNVTLNGPVLKNAFATQAAGNTYCMLQEGSAYTFHRLDMGLASVSLRPSDAGIYFTGTWSCDEALAGKIQTFGVAVSTKAMPEDDFVTQSHVLWTTFQRQQFSCGTAQTGAMIRDILSTEDDLVAQNNQRARTPVYATAYIVIDENTLVSDGACVSMHQVISAIDQQIAQLPQHKQSMKDFLAYWKNYGLTGDNWSFDFE